MNKRLIVSSWIASMAIPMTIWCSSLIAAPSDVLIPQSTSADISARVDGAALSDSHPVLSTNDHWASIVMVIILVGFFIPAAIIGPLARYLAADDLPELHTAEERDAHSATQHEPGHTRQF